MRKSCARFLLAAILLAVAPTTTYAASDEKVQEFAKLLNLRKMLDDMLPAITDAMVKAMRANNPNMPADIPDIVGEVVNETMTPLIPQMYEASLAMYREGLSDEDLDAAITFYRTPSGQHILQQLPTLMQKAAQSSQSLIMSHMGEIQQRMMQKMKERHPEMAH